MKLLYRRIFYNFNNKGTKKQRFLGIFTFRIIKPDIFYLVAYLRHQFTNFSSRSTLILYFNDLCFVLTVRSDFIPNFDFEKFGESNVFLLGRLLQNESFI